MSSDNPLKKTYTHQKKERPVLVVEDGQGKRLIELDKNIYSLGRGLNNSIVLHSKLVSRHHATLLRVSDTEKETYLFQIIDGDLQGNSSSNGLIINSTRCLSKTLQHKDLIIFGGKAQATYLVIDSSLQEFEVLESCNIDHSLDDLSVSSNHLETLIIDESIVEPLSEAALLRLASFPELLPTPIIEIDLSGKLTYFNPATFKEFPDLQETQLEHPTIAGLLAAVKEEKQHFFVREIEVGNAIFEQSVHYIAETRLIRSYLVNITKRKIAEEHIHCLNVELEKRVEERTQELLITNAKLEAEIKAREQVEIEIRNALKKEKELSELKSRFVTIASHEFRTPLTTILASAESLEYYNNKWSSEKKLSYLQRIQTTVKHMTKLLEDVLIMGKAEADKLEFKPQPLEIENFCRELVSELQLANHRQQNLNFVCVGECTSPLVDEKLLRHILGNLLSNAIKYSLEGGNVHFLLTCQNEAIVFQIQDEGIGIPAEDQQRLFEPFHRCTNAGNIPGTGLGLAIVKKSVEVHGGQITVESEVGVGTTFTVTLPLQKIVADVF